MLIYTKEVLISQSYQICSKVSLHFMMKKFSNIVVNFSNMTVKFGIKLL